MSKLIQHLPTHIGAIHIQQVAEHWHSQRVTGNGRQWSGGAQVNALSGLWRERLNQRDKLPNREFWKESVCF